MGAWVVRSRLNGRWVAERCQLLLCMPRAPPLLALLSHMERSRGLRRGRNLHGGARRPHLLPGGRPHAVAAAVRRRRRRRCACAWRAGLRCTGLGWLGRHARRAHSTARTAADAAPLRHCLACRHLRRLLVELLAVAKASRGKEEWGLDLSPVGEDFDPEAEL